jgi:protein-S-isoprenylcysteine O-methyltransferase Ste14
MSDPVRSTIIVVGLVFIAVAAYYRIQSQRSAESLDRTKEGWPILIGLRLTALVMAVLTIAILCKAAWVDPVLLPVPDGVRWFGVAGFICAVVWLLWMFHTLGRNLTDTVVTRRDAKFVDHGPYRLVRNPMYTGTLVLGVSLGIALGTWLLPLLAVVIFTLFATRTRTEEHYLIEKFGDQYRNYMTRVGRFFPGLGRESRGGKAQ